jgi:hypothetical protein
MRDLIADIDGVVAVGGLTLGADPIANAVMHASAGTPIRLGQHQCNRVTRRLNGL